MSIPFLPRTPNQVGVPPRLDHGKHEFVRIGMLRLLASTIRPLGGSSQGQVEQAGVGKVVLSVMVALMRSARRHTVPPTRVRSPKNFCKSDDIISSVIHIIRRL